MRQTNNIIDKISKDIDTLRTSIQNQVNSSDFNSITDTIYNSKEKLFKKGKTASGKKIQQTPTLPSTQEHCSTRAHLQEMGYQPCLQGSFTRQSQTTSKRSKICCNFSKGAFH